MGALHRSLQTLRGAWALTSPGVPWLQPLLTREVWLSPVGGGGCPGEIIWAQGSGPGSHGLLDGGLLAVGLEQRGGAVGQHGPLVAAELGPAVLKPDLRVGGRGEQGAAGRKGDRSPFQPRVCLLCPQPWTGSFTSLSPIFRVCKVGVRLFWRMGA